MTAQTQGRTKALGVTLEPDLFNDLAYYARRYEMPPRAFLAHLAKAYVDAMKQAEPVGKRGR